jgi:hypothetical protein
LFVSLITSINWSTAEVIHMIFYFSSVMVGETFSIELQPLTGSLSITWVNMEYWWNDTDRRTKGLGEKPASLSLCPSENPHGLSGK